MENSSLKKIQAIFMDVDGVLTNGKIILGTNNIELKEFNVKDGLAITMAKRQELKVGFITSRTSEVVERRGQELGVDFLFQGVTDKLLKLKEISSSENIPLQNICYIGDDLPDLDALLAVGFSATVSDACEEVKSRVAFVSTKNGGEGAVREIIEIILKAQNNWKINED